MPLKLLAHKRTVQILPFLVSLLFSLSIFKIHMTSNVDSMLNEYNTIISNGFLTSQIKYHEEFAPFARRPITSWLIHQTGSTFGIRPGPSFIWVNFFFLFLSAVLLYRLSKTIGANHRQGMWNMVAYFLTFSVLFAFFPPIFTYDEPVQYCFVFLALIAFYQRKWPFYLLCFTLAMISRETSALLIPGLMVLVSDQKTFPMKKGWVKYLRVYGILLLPLLFYMLYLVGFIARHDLWADTDDELSSRFSCFLENFENRRNIIETLTSLVMALGVFFYFAFFKWSRPHTDGFRKYLNAFFVTALINTPVVLLTAFARESRLFALPLFFLWPIFAQLLGKEFSFLSPSRFMVWIKNWRFSLPFLLFNGLSYFYCFEVFAKAGLDEGNYFPEYLFLSLLLISAHFTDHRYFLKYSPDRMT